MRASSTFLKWRWLDGQKKFIRSRNSGICGRLTNLDRSVLRSLLRVTVIFQARSRKHGQLESPKGIEERSRFCCPNRLGIGFDWHRSQNWTKVNERRGRCLRCSSLVRKSRLQRNSFSFQSNASTRREIFGVLALTSMPNSSSTEPRGTVPSMMIQTRNSLAFRTKPGLKTTRESSDFR